LSACQVSATRSPSTAIPSALPLHTRIHPPLLRHQRAEVRLRIWHNPIGLAVRARDVPVQAYHSAEADPSHLTSNARSLGLPNGLEMRRPASSSKLHYTRFAPAGRIDSIELLGRSRRLGLFEPPEDSHGAEGIPAAG
jgi:hypothetical protein